MIIWQNILILAKLHNDFINDKMLFVLVAILGSAQWWRIWVIYWGFWFAMSVHFCPLIIYTQCPCQRLMIIYQFLNIKQIVMLQWVQLIMELYSCFIKILQSIFVQVVISLIIHEMTSLICWWSSWLEVVYLMSFLKRCPFCVISYSTYLRLIKI